jgi:hypothetical protein
MAAAPLHAQLLMLLVLGVAGVWMLRRHGGGS